MFTAPIRLALFAVCIGLGVYGLYTGQATAWAYLLAAVLLVYGHFRYGPVWLAWRAVRNNDLERAKRLLAGVSNPGSLRPDQSAYFSFAQGLVALNEGDLGAAVEHLTKASEGKLRTSNDRSLAVMYLSAAKFDLGEQDAARALLEKARSIPHKSGVASFLDDLDAKFQAAR